MFLLWLIMISGTCLLGTIFFGWKMTKDSGRTILWWQWIMVAISAFLWVIAFAWLGSQLTELLGGFKQTLAAWSGFGVLAGISILLAVITVQLVRRQEPSGAKE